MMMMMIRMMMMMMMTMTMTMTTMTMTTMICPVLGNVSPCAAFPELCSIGFACFYYRAILMWGGPG